jgi:hypothetical protein
MSDVTDFQLRTNYRDEGAAHLWVGKASQAICIEETKSLSGHDSRATIYLDTAQWAELALFAMQKALEGTSNSTDDTHWGNERVVAWQDENRARAYEQRINEVRRYFAKLVSPVLGGTLDTEVILELLHREELREIPRMMGRRAQILYQITPKGKEANRIYEEGE